MSYAEEEGGAAAAAIGGVGGYMGSPPRNTNPRWWNEEEGYELSPGRGRFSMSTLGGTPKETVVDIASLDAMPGDDDSVEESPFADDGEGDDQGSGDPTLGQGQVAAAAAIQLGRRSMCRPGEKQLLMQILQEFVPEGTREAVARVNVWVQIAKRVLVPTDVMVTAVEGVDTVWFTWTTSEDGVPLMWGSSPERASAYSARRG